MSESKQQRSKILGALTFFGESPDYYKGISDYQEFLNEANKVFLKNILDAADVKLKDNTSRSLSDELSFWDNYRLVDLALSLPSLTSRDNLPKLKFIIEHSIRDDLAYTLALETRRKNPFLQYNANVMRNLKDNGISINNWANPDAEQKYYASKNPENPFTLELKLWRRDFRREFSIGNISECCIAVNGEPSKVKYREVLLDYFLDMSLQVSKIKCISSNGSVNRIGQIYFVPLLSEGRMLGKKKRFDKNQNSGLVLGITSVELAKDYREMIDIVPPIMNGILVEEGYRQDFGFEDVFVGHRFALFRDYMSQRKQAIANLRMKLKQYRSNAQDVKRQLKQSAQELGKVNSTIESLNFDITKTDSLYRAIFQPMKLSVQKFGLIDLPSDSVYRGTNYLDMLGRGEDGYINTYESSHIAEGFFIPRKSSLRFMETQIVAMSNKYKQKKFRIEH